MLSDKQNGSAKIKNGIVVKNFGALRVPQAKLRII